MNVKFNKTKVQFKVPNVTYMGHIVAADGLKPDTATVEAIVMIPKPENKSDLQRLLGVYLAQYIPNESASTAPLRSLLKQDIEWDWQHEHDQALEKIQTALTSAPTLQYYDVNKTVTVQADASQRGLGACLLQQGRPVAYASRALTSAEENYSEIEKEMLAICFACAKCHQYVYGKSIEVHTDHILRIDHEEANRKSFPRLHRMMLQLQRYTC